MGLYRRTTDGTDIWWCSYSLNGKRVRESTKTTSKREAERFLAERLVLKAAPQKGTIGKLLDALIVDYDINGQHVAGCRQYVAKHLRPYFGTVKVQGLDKATISVWVQQMLKDKYANATINRGLSLLRRAFTIADAPYPRIEKLAEDNTRTGFVENEQFWRLYPHLPDHLKAVALFSYETGCRRGEVVSTKWKQLDMVTGVVRLNPGETKNKQGRVIPLSEMMVFMLNRLPRKSEFVFTYKGKQFYDFRTGWKKACKAAGRDFDDFLFHDLRRSAVRNMVRSGTPERVAMAVSGHKTRTVFDRYNIVDETDLKQAMKSIGKARLKDLTYSPERSPELDAYFTSQQAKEEQKEMETEAMESRLKTKGD